MTEFEATRRKYETAELKRLYEEDGRQKLRIAELEDELAGWHKSQSRHYDKLHARIAELEAAIDLFIAYDETDDEDMVAMVQCYDAAIEAARKVRGK